MREVTVEYFLKFGGLALSLCRNMEDFLTWTDTSAIKKHVMAYNEQVSWVFFKSMCYSVYPSLNVTGEKSAILPCTRL